MNNRCIYSKGTFYKCNCRKRNNRVCEFPTEEEKCENFYERGNIFTNEDTGLKDKEGNAIKIGNVLNLDTGVVSE